MMSKLVGVSAHQSLRSVTLETQWGCQPTGRKVDAVEAGGGVSPPVVEKCKSQSPVGVSAHWEEGG